MEYAVNEFALHGQLYKKFGRNALVREDELVVQISNNMKEGQVPQHDFPLGLQT